MIGSMHIFSTTNQRSGRNISRPSFPTSTGQLLRNACRKILAYAAPAHSKIWSSSRKQKGSKHTNVVPAAELLLLRLLRSSLAYHASRATLAKNNFVFYLVIISL